MSIERSNSVKVVIINTKYVETDAMSFKDVVQRLTGKDSRVAYEPQDESSVAKSQYFMRDEGSVNYGRINNVVESSSSSSSPYDCSKNSPAGINGKSTTMSRSNSAVLMRNISFKEFERLFREMPPVEEIWADY